MTPISKLEMALPSLRMRDWRGGQRKGAALCPGHDDKDPSLSVAETTDGKVLLHCFVGCSTDGVLRALDMRSRDLLPAHGLEN